MNGNSHGALVASLMFSLAMGLLTVHAFGFKACADRLERLTSPSEREFLLAELARVQPPERLRELADYGRRQLDLGGGFYGMLPEQLADPDSIPLPFDAETRFEAAFFLAQQRQKNLEALKKINPDYALSFTGEPLSDFLGRMEPVTSPDSLSSVSLKLILDSSALTGFFTALADGEITAFEAAGLAALPSNQAMLQHRRNLGYVPEPLPDQESLAAMIRIAGSTDPLDRLWCWINPQNAFDYADLFQNARHYRRMLSELESGGDRLTAAALGLIEPYTPADTQFEARFALTIGWAIRGWATPQMAGINIEQVKDDWNDLLGTLIEETYHRLQLELFPTTTAAGAREFSDLVKIDTGDPRYDRLYEIVTYTVAEGAANLVRGRFAAANLAEKAPLGAELMARFVRQVVEQGDLESADSLINEGLRGNGPLYGLGWKLASLIAERDGKRAVGDLQRTGPVRFFLRAASLADDQGELLLLPAVTSAVTTLENRLPR